VLATVAAWKDGDSYLAEVRATFARNRELVAASLPAGVCHHLPGATYLAWLDCRGLGLGTDPTAFFLERAGVMLSGGPGFGLGSDGFTRLNFATSEPILAEILRRMRDAVEQASGR
jgi:cysteine-S-conjugate beta-lyase